MYRETVHEILDRYFDKLKKDIRSSNRESARALVSEGIRFVTAAPGDQEEFEGVVREVKDRLLEKEFPGEGLKKLREYIQEYRKTPSEGE
jgi:TRAP-type C4-dicarboxylate transport system substrate-binding protein